MKLSKLLKSFLIAFLLTVLMAIMMFFFIGIHKPEASFEIIVYISLIYGLLNGLCVTIYKIVRLSDYFEWQYWVRILEIGVYLELILFVERLFMHFNLIKVSIFFDFPFTYIYPLIIITILVYVFRGYLKKTI